MEIRQLSVDEKGLIQDFIDKYWKKGHSLVKSNALLDFQHLEGPKYNFYAAIQDGEVWALQGFITTSIFDESLGKGDAWGAIWKIRDDAPDKMVGIELLDRISKEYGFHSIGAIGISGIARKIYKMLSWETGFLRQYYIVNERMPSFSILAFDDKNTSSHNSYGNWRIDTCSSLIGLSEAQLDSYTPQKTIKYFINRYECHPIYKYSFWCIYKGDELKSIWAVRRHVINGSSIFRIVDVIGRIEKFPDLYNGIQDILFKESAEYVDILNYGISPEIIENIGFSEVDLKSDKVICPTYFEPFEKRNIIIELAYKCQGEYVCFKGDSDQDRPNIL